MIDLDEAERVGNAATKGPWEWEADDESMVSLQHGIDRFECGWPNKSDSDFIAYARNHWQEMVDEIRQLRQAIETLRKYADNTWVYWESDQDSKVGKRLKAMAGHLPVYDAEITKALSLAQEASK